MSSFSYKQCDFYMMWLLHVIYHLEQNQLKLPILSCVWDSALVLFCVALMFTMSQTFTRVRLKAVSVFKKKKKKNPGVSPAGPKIIEHALSQSLCSCFLDDPNVHVEWPLVQFPLSKGAIVRFESSVQLKEWLWLELTQNRKKEVNGKKYVLVTNDLGNSRFAYRFGNKKKKILQKLFFKGERNRNVKISFFLCYVNKLNSTILWSVLCWTSKIQMIKKWIFPMVSFTNIQFLLVQWNVFQWLKCMGNGWGSVWGRGGVMHTHL